MVGRAVRFTLVFLVLTGLLYPLATTGFARLLFPHQAAGSLVKGADGQVVGSELIGQMFTRPEFFHGRISANKYDATASGGTNYAPTDEALLKRVQEDVANWERENPGESAPPDLLTASGSGLDPEISPEAAIAQIPRVSKTTGIPVEKLRVLVSAHVQGRTLGILGEPRVNVLQLNLDLQKLQVH